MRNVYIINPKAGKHDHTVQFMERIRAVHATHGEEPEIYLTQRTGHGEELARAAAEKGDAVRLSLKRRGVFLFDRETGERIR